MGSGGPTADESVLERDRIFGLEWIQPDSEPNPMTSNLREPDRPFVAVTAPVKPRPDNPTLRTIVESGYLKGVEIAGALPVVLSPALEESTSGQLLQAASGLVLTGGGDVDPQRYGSAPEGARGVSPARDELEMQAAERALERGMPVLAICRGMQLLNVVLGGSLFRDLKKQRGGDLDHDRAGKMISRDIHDVRVEGLSLLEGVFQGEVFRANSTHHQGIREMGEGLVAVGWAEDDLVEAVEYRDGRSSGWVVGVQWHPERMLDERTGTNRRLFERFGQAVREYVGGEGG